MYWYQFFSILTYSFYVCSYFSLYPLICSSFQSTVEEIEIQLIYKYNWWNRLKCFVLSHTFSVFHLQNINFDCFHQCFAFGTNFHSMSWKFTKLQLKKGHIHREYVHLHCNCYCGAPQCQVLCYGFTVGDHHLQSFKLSVFHLWSRFMWDIIFWGSWSGGEGCFIRLVEQERTNLDLHFDVQVFMLLFIRAFERSEFTDCHGLQVFWYSIFYNYNYSITITSITIFMSLYRQIYYWPSTYGIVPVTAIYPDDLMALHSYL